jgi:hypothetical protein
MHSFRFNRFNTLELIITLLLLVSRYYYSPLLTFHTITFPTFSPPRQQAEVQIVSALNERKAQKEKEAQAQQQGDSQNKDKQAQQQAQQQQGQQQGQQQQNQQNQQQQQKQNQQQNQQNQNQQQRKKSPEEMVPFQQGAVWRVRTNQNEFSECVLREEKNMQSAPILRLKPGDLVEQAGEMVTLDHPGVLRMPVMPKGWVTVSAENIGGPKFLEVRKWVYYNLMFGGPKFLEVRKWVYYNLMFGGPKFLEVRN